MSFVSLFVSLGLLLNPWPAVPYLVLIVLQAINGPTLAAVLGSFVTLFCIAKLVSDSGDWTSTSYSWDTGGQGQYCGRVFGA